MCTANETYSKMNVVEKFEELEQDLWIAAEGLGIDAEELVRLEEDFYRSTRKAYYDRRVDTIIVNSNFFENAEYTEVLYVCLRELYIKYLCELVKRIKYKKEDRDIELVRKLKLWKAEFKHFYDNKIIFREPHPDKEYYNFDLEAEACKAAKKIMDDFGFNKEDSDE